MTSLAALGTSTPASQTAVAAQDLSKSEATKKFDVIVIPDCECQILFKVYKKIVGFEELLKKDHDLVWLRTSQQMTKPTTLHVTVPADAKACKIFAKRNGAYSALISSDDEFRSVAVKISANRFERGSFEKTKAVLPKDAEEQIIVIDGASVSEDESNYRGYLLPKIGDGVL